MLLKETVIGTRHHGVLYLVAAHLVYFLCRAVLVGVSVVAAILLILGLRLSRLIDEVLLHGCPQLVVEEVLLAAGVDDDVYLGGVDACKHVVASQDETLGTQCLRAVALGLHAQVDGCQVGTAHEGRVGDGEQHGDGLVALHGVLVELDGLQVLLVVEGILGPGHSAGVVVGALPTACAGIDGHLLLVGHALDVGVIDQVLGGRGNDVASAYQTHLMDVRQDVLAHALAQGFAVVRTAAAPAPC